MGPAGPPGVPGSVVSGTGLGGWNLGLLGWQNQVAGGVLASVTTQVGSRLSALQGGELRAKSDMAGLQHTPPAPCMEPGGLDHGEHAAPLLTLVCPSGAQRRPEGRAGKANAGPPVGGSARSRSRKAQLWGRPCSSSLQRRVQWASCRECRGRPYTSGPAGHFGSEI